MYCNCVEGAVKEIYMQLTEGNLAQADRLETVFKARSGHTHY